MKKRPLILLFIAILYSCNNEKKPPFDIDREARAIYKSNLTYADLLGIKFNKDSFDLVFNKQIKTNKRSALITAKNLKKHLDDLYMSAGAKSLNTGSGKSSSKWSQSAVETAERRVKEWQSSRYVKVETSTNKAYINPTFWRLANVDEKKEILMTIVIFTDVETGEDNNFYDFYDYNSGKQIASWSKISDFDFDY